MSSKIFYSKTPIRPNQHAPAFVNRLRAVADFLRKNGEKTLVRDKRSSTTIKFTMNGVTAIYDQYYEDKTITIEDVGVVHYSMNRCESYYDINVNALNEVESKNRNKKPVRRTTQKAA